MSWTQPPLFRLPLVYFQWRTSDLEQSAQVLKGLNVLQSPCLQVPSAFSVLPNTIPSAQILAATNVFPTPSPSVSKAAGMLSMPPSPAQVLTATKFPTATNILPSPSPQFSTATNVFQTPSPQNLRIMPCRLSPIIYSTPSSFDSASHSLPYSNPFTISPVPTPSPNPEDWRTASPSSSMELDSILPKPYAESYRIGTHVPPTFYQADHPPINPFFTLDETNYLNTLTAVAEFHGEHDLASSIEAALLLPYPDPDIVHSLVEEHVLDEQDEFKVIKYARARDRALEIRRVRLYIVAYRPFRSSTISNASQLRICACFDDDEIDDDSDSNNDEQGPSESHIFFLP
ncbi:hypothetical protein DFJ58DRAFT_855528 [Suillus subalutaceus]|uniref:uncharacterized protein n=1 Tax=Suillus subalutaceus TaxID=48586 RepID=UPI001B87A352|nr:uncharacterized protein DFJ58DRAFT_855528 [Suillus subalutaceus]KAG1842197.1 hypothetical protein DFJ58DRAFT_855528 [Suillus subalutaceus]